MRLVRQAGLRLQVTTDWERVRVPHSLPVHWGAGDKGRVFGGLRSLLPHFQLCFLKGSWCKPGRVGNTPQARALSVLLSSPDK